MCPPYAMRLLGLVGFLGVLAAVDAADSIWFPSAGPARAPATRDTRIRSSQSHYNGAPNAAVAAAPAPNVGDATAAVATAATDAPVPLGNIPVDILRTLSDVENATYFLNNFVDTESYAAQAPTDIGGELENRFGAGDERKSVLSAKPALCQPQLELVPLMITTDPTMYYYPTCTRIERCGGCCGSNLLTCQPTETEIVNVKVIVTQYVGKPQMVFKGHEIIPIERHTKCKCDCIKKEKDCNQLQEYRKNECECVCMNVDEQQKCLAEKDIKEWDPSTCTCNCREARDCNSNSYYDQDNCSCTQRSSFRSRRREIYFHEPTL